MGFSFRRPFSRRPETVCGILLLSALMACAAPEKTSFGVRDLTLLTESGKRVMIDAEIAVTEEERSRGLMYRKSLPDGKGMLFVFDRDHILSFWMKDTLIPLSIAFIAYDGRILEIRDMRPQNLNSVQSSRAARYALEVPQGWFGRAGVGAGDRLVLDFSP